MSYAIDPGKPLDAEVRRVAEEQIDKAISSLREAGPTPHEAIHDARKRLKKLRGLIRLIRPEAPDFYKARNGAFRNTARKLSGVRDRAALVAMIERLEARFKDEIVSDAFEPVKAKLLADRNEAIERSAGDAARSLETALGALANAKSAVHGFHFKGGKHKPRRDARVAAAGLAKTYDEARTALAKARTSRDVHDLHELRKHTKYHWMHLRLLAPLWPDGFAPAIDLAKRIADDLGDDHDIAVFRGAVEADPQAFGDTNQRSIVLALAGQYQAELRARGLKNARTLFVEKPDAIVDRIERLYRRATRETKRQDEAPAIEPKAALRVA